MPTYTTLLQSPFDQISPEDDNFIEELLDVAQLFRPFSEGLDEFISTHGYNGDIAETKGKVAFIRDAFVRSGMTPPRELEKWYTRNQSVRRDTIFQLCFAFGLDGSDTDEFFRKVYTKERSFDCHRVQEAVYYFCLNHGLSFAEAQDVIAQLPVPPKQPQSSPTAIYTASIIAELNRMDTREELFQYLTDNISQFSRNNVTAYATIDRLWREIAGKDGLLEREYRRFFVAGDDTATGKQSKPYFDDEGFRAWDAYLAIFQLDKKQVSKLKPERTIRPVIEQLHADAQDSFPDRQGIEAILAGKPASYERIRKLLILLEFYVFWARKRLETGSCDADEQDGARFIATVNQYMIEAGYPELYVGNPYDWIFFYVSHDREPLITFREIWQSLLDNVSEASANPD